MNVSSRAAIRMTFVVLCEMSVLLMDYYFFGTIWYRYSCHHLWVNCNCADNLTFRLDLMIIVFFYDKIKFINV